MSRPKCESVKHVRQGRSATVRKEREASTCYPKNRPDSRGLSGDGDGYVQKVDEITP